MENQAAENRSHTMESTYDIFVSYSHADEVLVKPVVKFLGLRGRRVFWDDKIAPGERWSNTIRKALQASATVVVLWCCHSAGSAWVKREADEANSARKELVPVLLCSYPLDAPLEEYQAIDYRESIRHDCSPRHSKGESDKPLITTELLLRRGLGIKSFNDRAVEEKWLELTEMRASGEVARIKPQLSWLTTSILLFTLVAVRPFETDWPQYVILVVNLLVGLTGVLTAYLGSGISVRRQIRQAAPESQRLGLAL